MMASEGEHYVVSTTFTVKDDLTAKLEQIAAAAMRVSKAVSDIKVDKSFTQFMKAANGVQGSMRSAADAAGNFGVVAVNAGRNASQSMDGVVRNTSRVSAAMKKMADDTRRAYTTMGAVPGAANTGTARMPSMAGWAGIGRSYAAPGVASNMNASPIGSGLPGGIIPRGLPPYVAPPKPGNSNNPAGIFNIPPVPPGAAASYNVHTGALPIGGRGGRWAGLGGIGGGMGLLIAGQQIGDYGRGILGAIGGAVGNAFDYQHQIALMQIAGISPSDIRAAERTAWATSRAMPTTTATENLKALSEMRSVLGSMGEARSFLLPMQQYSAIASAQLGRSADAYTAMRAAEMLGWTTNRKTGALDPDRANQFLGVMAQTEIASHGRVSEREWLNFAQQASLAAKGMSAQGLLQMYPIISEMGGFRAGTALQSINQQLVGGVMPQRVVEDWNKLGLLDMSKVSATRTGVRLGAGAIKGEDQVGGNIVAWIEGTLLPAMQAKGYTRDTMVQGIMRLFSRSTSQREAGLIATQLVQIDKDVKQAQATMPIAKAASGLMGDDPTTLMKAFSSQWTNFSTALGRTIIPIVLPALKGMTDALNGLADIATKHPTITRFLTTGAAIFGGILLVAGGLAAIVAPLVLLASVVGGPAVLIGVGISALASGLISLATMVPWGQLANFGTRLGTAIWDAIKNAWNWVTNQIKSLIPGQLAPGATSNTDARHFGHAPASTGSDRDPANPHAAHTIAHAIKQALNGVSVTLDGRKVGQLAINAAAETANRTPPSSGRFDSRMSMLHPAFS